MSPHDLGRWNNPDWHWLAGRCSRASPDLAPPGKAAFRDMGARIGAVHFAHRTARGCALQARPLWRKRNVRGVLPRSLSSGRSQAGSCRRFFARGVLCRVEGVLSGLRDMPEAERAKFHMTAVSFVNELYGDETAKRAARIKGGFINNAMMATLLGDVISDGLDNGKVVSGVGGQYNFIAQLLLSTMRAPLSCCAHLQRQRARDLQHPLELWPRNHSTTSARYGRDRIWCRRPARKIGPQCHRRNASIANSRFQTNCSAAKDPGKIEKDFGIPVACRTIPKRIESALGPARAAGLIEPFPSEPTSPKQSSV